MFEQQLTGQEPDRGPLRDQMAKPVMSTAQKTFFVFLIITALIIATFGVTFFIQNWQNKKIGTENPNPPRSTSTLAADELAALLEKSRLANTLPTTTVMNLDNVASSSGLSAIEYLSFGDFYQAPDNKIAVQINDYRLPINIKTDVINYYDISRKINIDKVVNDLNRNGFAIIDNPFSGLTNAQNQDQKVTDFYSVYDTLNSKQIPSLITSDFLTYYYQNLTKKAFKDIEENVFYYNLWDLSDQMYNIARNRYNKRLTEVGDVNDPILEGARLEMAYFATALEILKPADEQVNQPNNTPDPNKFSTQEAYDFSFNPASYLKVDVLEEVRLIRSHNSIAKSPVLLSQQDYNTFVVPEDYRLNAKLNNFYLTTKWLNSAFPLYYQGPECPTCYLDVNDWRVHTVAACFIAQDLFDNYNLKNEWARVYKILSYFKGLRADLTYVHYRDALSAAFGKDYRVEDIFSSANPQMPDNFKRFQQQLASYDLPAIDGALDKNVAANRDQLGARLLSNFYWPNQYIFDRLTYPVVGSYRNQELKSSNVTGCRLDNLLVRCMGFGLDIINLLSPIPTSNTYFMENTNYGAYATAVKNLQAQINDASANWQANNFWTMLKTISSSLANPVANWPIYGRNAAWRDREIGRALGTWANLQTPLDTLGAYQKSTQVQNAANSFPYYQYAYVEPNWQLINELLADSTMINGMFDVLQLNSAVKSMSINLNDLYLNLTMFQSIIEKELKGVALSGDDYQFLDKFTKNYRVAKSGTKTFQLVGHNQQLLNEDVSGVKLLLVVQKQGQDLILTAGPIFNYWEKK